MPPAMVAPFLNLLMSHKYVAKLAIFIAILRFENCLAYSAVCPDLATRVIAPSTFCQLRFRFWSRQMKPPKRGASRPCGLCQIFVKLRDEELDAVALDIIESVQRLNIPQFD